VNQLTGPPPNRLYDETLETLGVIMRTEREEAADYIAALSAELAQIARQHSFDSAAYLLEIAAAEAESLKLNPAIKRTLRVVA
jgi:hypothetical protein